MHVCPPGKHEAKIFGVEESNLWCFCSFLGGVMNWRIIFVMEIHHFICLCYLCVKINYDRIVVRNLTSVEKMSIYH